MIETVLTVSLFAWFVSLVVSNAVRILTKNEKIAGVSTFASSALVAHFMVSGLWPIIAVALAPIWVTIVVILVVGTVGGAFTSVLARRGYLGKQHQWMVELMEEDDRQYEAAKTLMSRERMSEIAEVSTDKEDFKENVIEAAGLNDIEEKDVQEALNARQ